MFLERYPRTLRRCSKVKNKNKREIQAKIFCSKIEGGGGLAATCRERILKMVMNKNIKHSKKLALWRNSYGQ